MKFGIGPKIVILLLAVVISTAGLLVYFLSNGTSKIVISHELGDLSDETMLRARELQTHLYSIRRVVQSLEYDAEEFQNFLTAGDEGDLESLRDTCRVYCESFPDSYLRLEVWLRDGDRYTRVDAPDERDQRAAVLDEKDGRGHASSIARLEDVLSQLDEPYPLEPFLSEIDNVSVQDGAGTRRIHAVWSGLCVRDPQTKRELFLAALVDLDAPQPDGDNSPLTSICNSPRHLTILANDPTARVGDAGIDGKAVGRGLVFLDESKEPFVDVGPLEMTLAGLYDERQKLSDVERLVQPILPRSNRVAVPQNSVQLRKTLWFLQSDSIPDRALRQQLAERIEALREKPGALPPGTRIGGLRGAVDNIRILANERNTVEDVARRISEGVPVTWRSVVECEHCNTRFALFPVRSEGMPDDLRYYGLAHSAFDEEMIADVNSELSRVWQAALWVVSVIALIGFGASLLFTRPLKQITAAAEAVGQTKVDPNPNNDGWRREIDAIVQQLPARRRDEIGVLARAFQQMVGEVVAGHVRLQQLNADLDRRITERTIELEVANDELTVARDKADELNRAKDAFLASVSHELRNPLNQVSGFCQLLEITDLDEEQLADLKKIQQAGGQLLALINDILDYQKIIMGGITLEPETFEVSQLLNEVRDAMTFPAQENHIDLKVDWSSDVGTMNVDKQRIRQVLLNLAGNACKFTHEGTVHIHARRAASPKEPGDDVVFSVEDTGRGMTPEEQAKLFTPFTKLAAKQGNRTGTGLGLVISKGFCELMGGSISLTSEFGKGSTFTVRIPAHTRRPAGAAPAGQADSTAPDQGPSAHAGRPASDGHKASVPESEHEPAADGTERTVLVIDDDENVRELMKRYLESQGFDIRTAATGIEGLELARKLRPAVITLDAIMPGLDGWAVLAALKANEETANIPVVMVTMVDNQRRGQIMGAAEFIVKPIDWRRLSRVLSRYAPHHDNRTVLIVDDSADDREVLRRNLVHEGWTVMEAENGAAALDVLAQHTPSVILLDLVMPVMDGFEFLDRRSESDRAIPVLVVTAKDPTPEEFRRLHGQTVRVLQKGHYTRDDLLREIHRRVDAHLAAPATALGKETDA